MLDAGKVGLPKGISDTQKRSKGAVFGHFSLSKFLDRRCLAYCLIQFFFSGNSIAGVAQS
jgi:hypothetical protein